VPEDDVVQHVLRHVAGRSAGRPGPVGLRVTLNFHPGRLVGGVPVLGALARDGVYRSQFVTRTGNGGLTAHPGGDRWRWEQRLFGGHYDDRAAVERPVYGALDRRPAGYGGAPRFGSAHLRLVPDTLSRATFCYPDSHADPDDVAVASTVGALLERADRERGSRDPLDDYVEAQVHGTVRLDRDVEAVVLDPCYRGTVVEDAARTLPCAVEWHGGFRLGVDRLDEHEDYRGPQAVALARRLAGDGVLTPDVLDAAIVAGYDAQRVKHVWHVLARVGPPGGVAPAS
jgi:Protein of unknown function (DUF3626)